LRSEHDREVDVATLKMIAVRLQASGFVAVLAVWKFD
jgi:hypothetical protein